MCHTAAVGALSICWWLGIPLVLAPRFSASTFWSECAQHGVTVVQYVGELCRYLLATPPSPHDSAHRVRLALGNGLRPDVWPRFKARFGIERVAELYASTEGNANLANTEDKEGAVGFISPLLAPVYPVRLVRLADSSAAGGEIARGPNGLALLCGGGEAGELLGLVNQRDAARNFAGYTDVTATRRKLVRDVLKRGDCWFRTGDLLRTDDEGFVYFVDRMGDTFRYKGENVSTAEVAAAIGAIRPLRLAQCVVYGVQLPQARSARSSAPHTHAHYMCALHAHAHRTACALCVHAHCMRTHVQVHAHVHATPRWTDGSAWRRCSSRRVRRPRAWQHSSRRLRRSCRPTHSLASCAC
jgi:acyl-CoA synthetase (AMP-forming)/AMP-acid ligase II